MSGGTEKRDRAGYGTLRADGALAISHKKESALGNFRAVINGPLGDEFEAKVLCFANCYVYVRLFFCVGRPDEDTCSVSGNVWSYPLSGTHVYVCGKSSRRADLAIAHGDILRLRYVRACGTVDARINSRSEVRLFDGVFGDELYAGFFLGDHSRVRLLEINGRPLGMPAAGGHLGAPARRGFCELMSGSVCDGTGELNAGGASAVSHSKNGCFRAVIEGPLNDGFVAQAMPCGSVRGSSVRVSLFICVGKPKKDTWCMSAEVMATSLAGGCVYVGGKRDEVSCTLNMDMGDVLTFRFTRAWTRRGMIEARVNNAPDVVRLFDGEFGEEVYAGFLLSGEDTWVRLLEINGRPVCDVQPAAESAVVRVVAAAASGGGGRGEGPSAGAGGGSSARESVWTGGGGGGSGGVGSGMVSLRITESGGRGAGRGSDFAVSMRVDEAAEVLRHVRTICSKFEADCLSR